MSQTLRWGIIGTGAIARCFANALAQTENGELVAVGSRSQESAEQFIAEHAGEGVAAHSSYESLLADDQVQAVYISTPHPMHTPWSVRASEAGKHVLCEKPAGLNRAQAMVMLNAAIENSVLWAEAFMYRCHPQTAKLVELIQAGEIGEVRMIEASFGFGGGDSINSDSRLFSLELGGGGILDVGCYPVSISRLVAAAAMGQAVAEPQEVRALARLGETGVDEWAAATLKFDNDIVAQVATSVRCGLANTLTVCGSKGKLEVPNPWQASRTEGTPGKIILKVGDEPREIEVPVDRNSFAYEIDAFAAAATAGESQLAFPAMTHADTEANLRTLDAWRAEIELAYPDEKPQTRPTQTAAHRPLKRRPDAEAMPYGNVEHVDIPVSKLVMGCDNQQSYNHAAAMFDDWFERGGNAFDTGWIYGGGKPQQLLGQWHNARGIRDQLAVIMKPGHTPRCLPELIRQDMEVCLERQQTDYADMCVLHRDNLDVPVGELVDVLNEFVDAGKTKAIGGSNWTLERFAEANAYAEKHGKRKLTVLSNNLSLARMVHPVWADCQYVSEPKDRQWLAEHGIANFAWSSQARGYFLPEHLRMRLGAKNFECWDAPDNRDRRERAEQLAEKKGVSPINIAAAFVLNQPFPSFALIGPRSINETRTTMPSLGVQLTQEEVDWLWNGE